MLPPGATWCAPCEDTLLPVDAAASCPVCQDLAGAQTCARCRAAPPPFDAVVAAFAWGGAVKDAIHRMKFSGAAWAAEPLARRAWPDGAALPGGVDVVVPLPLHPARHRARGYNQAALLARRWAALLGVPLAPAALARTRATAAVADLAPAQRASAVAGAFSVAQPARVRGRRVLLVDDVVTTGATAREAAAVLKAAGAASVRVACVARGGAGAEP